jgi:hypothetical protein
LKRRSSFAIRLHRTTAPGEVAAWLTSLSSSFDAEENFAGARNILAEDSFMTKRALPGVIGFLGLCLTLSAQQTGRPDVLRSLNSSPPRFPSLTLSNGGFFSFSSALSWVESAPDFLPGLPEAAPPRPIAVSAAAARARDSSKEVIDVQRTGLFDYAGGEVGFLYGRSMGKSGGDYKQAYIIGEVGDDKFHISAGAAYEESSWRVPRSGR